MKTSWKSLLLVCSLSAALFAAGELTDPRYDKEMQQAIDLILKQDYPAAERICNSLILKDRNYPAGYFMKMNLIAARFYDLTDTSSLPEFFRLADTLLLLTGNSEEPIYVFYRGAAYAYLSVIHTKEDRWVSGALNGKKSTDIFKKMLKEGVVSGDVLGMVGTYHYWSSVLMKNFYWLPFIDDRREQGIVELTVARKNAKYLQFAIISSLLWIYYDNNRMAEALELCDQVLAAYPGHRIFMQVKMHILYKQKAYGPALQLAGALANAYAKLEQVPVNYTAMRIKQALIYYSMGKKKEGDALSGEILKVPYSDYMKTRLEKEFQFLDQAKNGNGK